MLYVITGGSASGKSEYAEKLATQQYRSGAYDRLYYIATMYPYDAECLQRIERHQLMRRDKGFRTIECYTALSALSVSEKDVLLLECMSNLLANEMYLPQGSIRQRSDEAVASVTETVLKPLWRLQQSAGALFVVTNEVFSDGGAYDAETGTYLRLLGYINQKLAQRADGVIEVVCGIPVCQKGELLC
ncbi:MAG: bifunctional adenosylcobinamide kinase/adenosylcobinamide-phosphate guanylyltransferase [Lachnospiraceae bacterium]|nr:bifunctional adenosylcobinamide kinase/adenosylcobinamide-phosphate guanylyltransferase [Lachnospiraceae bacterium]